MHNSERSNMSRRKCAAAPCRNAARRRGDIRVKCLGHGIGRTRMAARCAPCRSHERAQQRALTTGAVGFSELA